MGSRGKSWCSAPRRLQLLDEDDNQPPNCFHATPTAMFELALFLRASIANKPAEQYLFLAPAWLSNARRS